METRTITQAKIYFLTMNPITDRAESVRVAMMSTDRQSLIDRYKNEEVEPYSENGYYKTFRKDGPLEWFNSLPNLEQISSFNGEGLHEEWVYVENISSLQNQYYFI